MIVKCEEKDYLVLKNYLRQEAIFNTFIISDIENHGFDKPYQTIYMQKTQEGECGGVFLTYYNNFIVAGDCKTLEVENCIPLIASNITTVMGKLEVIKIIHDKMKQEKIFTKKKMYFLPEHKNLKQSDKTITAKMEDVDDIHEFLMSIPQFKELYAEREMIVNRITNQEGVHIFIKEKGEIIAHGNSAASTEKTCMIGGICVKEAYRGQGYAKIILSQICREIRKENKIPCIFADEEPEYRIFNELGFEQYGDWGVVQIMGGYKNES